MKTQHLSPFKNEHFMQQVRDRLVAVRPDLAGRLDWDTIEYLYNQGKTVEQTVNIYLEGLLP